MSFLPNLLLVLQIAAALVMIGLILLQHGKGADMGAAFGSGSSGSLFGASGSANFLSRSTAVAATVFLASTLALAGLGGHTPASKPGSGSVFGAGEAPAPAATASAAPAARAASAPALASSAAAPATATGASPAASSPARAASGVEGIPGQ